MRWSNIFLGEPEKPVIVSRSSVVTLSTSHKSKLGLPTVGRLNLSQTISLLNPRLTRPDPPGTNLSNSLSHLLQFLTDYTWTSTDLSVIKTSGLIQARLMTISKPRSRCQPQSGTSSILQSPKWELKGHWCPLHLQNQDREPKFRSWVYQRPVTISESK